jgi:PAS domain S-box-containing protein
MNHVTHPTSAEELLKLAAVELPIVIWQTDTQLRFTASFGAGLAGLKLKDGEVVGVSLFDFFQTADPDFPPIKLHREALAGKTGSYEIDWAGCYYHYCVAPLRSEQGAIVGCIGMAQDITESRRSQAALRESESRFRAFPENTADVTLIVSADGTPIYISPSMKRMAGYDPQGVIGRPVSDFIHPDDLDNGLQTLTRAAASPGETIHLPNFRVRYADGRYRHCEASFTGMMGVPGVDGILVHCRDATDRVEAEDALKRSEARFRAVFDHAGTGIALANLKGDLLQWNDAFREMLGYSDEELWKINFRAFTFPEDVAPEVHGIREVVAGQRDVYRSEKRYRRKDGTVVWGNFTCTVVRDSRGEPSFAIGTVEDITQRKRVVAELLRARDELAVRVNQRTADLGAANDRLREEIEERRQAEMALKESEERFRLAFEESPWGMTIIALDGTWLQVNRAFCKMLGYTRDQLLRMSVAQVTHPNDLKRNSELTRQLADGTIPSFRFEKRYLHRNGRVVWAAVNATLVRGEDGRVLYGLTMVEDITQRKQAQQALRRAERLASIGTLAAGIAHEVNNPLGAIQLDAETALYCSRQPSKQHTVSACLKNIAASARRGGQIVKDVLRFARSESTPKTVGDLRDAVVGACRLTRRLAEKHCIKIDYTPPDAECRVLLNSTEIEQVLVNLITNSILASRSGDRVEIELQRDPETVCALVRDFGVGMTSEQMDRIFDPFYTTRGSAGGTGLGLSISYGIVREHGGSIDVHSQPDNGTTMIVRLPNHPTE